MSSSRIAGMSSAGMMFVGAAGDGVVFVHEEDVDFADAAKFLEVECAVEFDLGDGDVASGRNPAITPGVDADEEVCFF